MTREGRKIGTRKMDTQKKKELEAKGWMTTTVQDFLELTPEEVAYIELKLKLSRELKTRRTAMNLTQEELAERIQSSQSRIAKMEKGDSSVSVDLLIRSLFALEATSNDIARAITVKENGA